MLNKHTTQNLNLLTHSNQDNPQIYSQNKPTLYHRSKNMGKRK